MSTPSYQSLFSAVVRDHPRFSALAAAILKQAEDLLAVLPSLNLAFYVDTAEGTQLDLLGSTLGIPRSSAADPSDETYRAALKAKLALWRWPGTNETVPAFLQEAFPGQGVTMTDNGDMTVTANTSEADPALLPVPAGVRTLSS